jgi:predicted ATPase/DNA-binding SARP family transcriptional activator
MQHLKIALLGPPQILIEHEPFETERHKTIGLLAYLAVEEKSHSREALAALLWPDYPRTSAFAYLRRTIWELNQKLGGGWLITDRERVQLVRQPGFEVDTEEFRRLVNQPESAVKALEEAVKLYRGDFLQGLVVADTAPFQDWQLLQAEAFRHDLGSCLEKIIAAYENSKAYHQALPYAQQWLALDRLNESASRATMRQLAGMGERNEVIRVYKACAEIIKKELGVPLQRETEALYQEILHGEQKPGQLAKQPEIIIRPEKKVEGNLPILATPFIGREEELRQIAHLALDPQVHLLTLTGPGGTGKTRLSIQVAAGLIGAFQDGVWFVPMATVQSVQGIISSIAQGFNISFSKGQAPQRQQLLDFLREKHLLLVLDNFEHLLDEGRGFVLEILGTAKRVKLLVTSRERLNVQPEQVYRVSGMSLPDPAEIARWEHPEEKVKAYSAIQLLLERARRVKPEFEVTRHNLQPVLEICQLVDGSPLGIELAAAWLEVLPEEQIAQEIVRSLDFLESTAVDIPERQRSLRLVFDTSWKLLNAEEQRAFRRLCIFRGSFTRQAAEMVSGASLRSLLSLANKSWLQQSESGRYQLHEVLKQFGMERLKADLAEWEETREREAEFYCSFLEEQRQALITEQQIQALQRLKPELESNIPDAWEWLVSKGRFEVLVNRMLPGIYHYCLIRSDVYGLIPLLKQARTRIPASKSREIILQKAILETAATGIETIIFVYEDHPRERMERLWQEVNQQHLQDEMGFWWIILVLNYGLTINYLEGARRIDEYLPKISQQPDSWEKGFCYLLAGILTEDSAEETRRNNLMKALEIFKKLGVVREQGTALRGLSSVAALRMDYETAIKYTMEAQAFYEQVGDQISIDDTWTNLAEYYVYLGKIDEAIHAYEEIRQYNAKMGFRRTVGTDLSWESLHLSRYGSLDSALKLRLSSLEIAKEVDNQHDQAWATWELGEVYRLMGQVEQARKYYQEALPVFEHIREFIGIGFYYRGCGDLAAMQGDWEKARQAYQEAMSYHEKEMRGNREWGLALTNARMGTALMHLGQLDEAKQYLKTSLVLAVGWKNPDLKAVPLVAIAGWLAESGSLEKAVELATCVVTKATTWNEVKQQAGEILEGAKRGLPADSVIDWVRKGEKMSIDAACKLYMEENSF